MKKVISLTLAIMLCFAAMLSTAAMAAEAPAQKTEVTQLSNGVTVSVTTTVYPNYTRASTRYAEQEAKYTDNSGNLLFVYTLCANFTYNGSTSRCTSATSKVRETTFWKLDSSNEYYSGSTAYGQATFKGPFFDSMDADAQLTCDKNGNIS